jgi:hypothetical protein
MDLTELETLIDRFDLPTVLKTLEEVCLAKADHLRSNWSDEFAAREWQRMARRIRKAAQSWRS